MFRRMGVYVSFEPETDARISLLPCAIVTRAADTMSAIDCSSALQRVHMSRNPVIPMVRDLPTTSLLAADGAYRSFSVLGMVPGVIVTISVAASVQYTSLILWRFCLKHPEIRDVCDIGKMLFGGSELAYNITAVFFILNNTFIQGAFTVSHFPPLHS